MPITKRATLERAGLLLEDGVRRRASRLSEQSTLFLSHANADSGRLVRGAIKILSEHGARVYADDLDVGVRSVPPRRFGSYFSRAIADTGKLVALVSRAFSASRWVSWELGLAHGLHTRSHVAVWPFVDANEDERWVSQEYLAIYPRIERHPTTLQWAVRDPADGLYWRLAQWLDL